MDPALEHQDLGPPRPPRVLMRGLPVAIVVHVLFIMALGWGVQWKRQPDPAMAAVPLPPVTAAAPASTATMGAGPAPSPAAGSNVAAVAPPVSREAPPHVARVQPPAAPAVQPERVSPSFDCRLARSVPEKIICADAELSRLDRDLGRLHARAKAAAADPAAFKRQNDAEWRRREQSCRDRDCLLRWYAQRRDQLEAALAASNRRSS